MYPATRTHRGKPTPYFHPPRSSGTLRMKWRFADLPVRTKFLVTLAIPVSGMVLLIGKQMMNTLAGFEYRIGGSFRQRIGFDQVNRRSQLLDFLDMDVVGSTFHGKHLQKKLRTGRR